jgi:H+/Cl- antiporter ClcA
MFVLPISYATLIFPGIPLYLLVRRLKWRSAWVYAIIGVFCSFSASVVVWWGTFADKTADGTLADWKPFIAFSVIAGILGFATGLLFWGLARPGRDEIEDEAVPND